MLPGQVPPDRRPLLADAPQNIPPDTLPFYVELTGTTFKSVGSFERMHYTDIHV